MQTKEWDQRGIDLVCDITRIPEPDASFDAIMCIEVLEHVPDPVAALRELSRLIRAGGRLILTAPFCSLTHYAPYHFSTGFSRYFYEQWLPEFGFEITELSFNGNYFEYLAQEVRRIPFVRNKYATGASAGRIHWCIEAAAIRFMLWWLDRLNRHDAGSHEVLAYGLHVQAVQRG